MRSPTFGLWIVPRCAPWSSELTSDRVSSPCVSHPAYGGKIKEDGYNQGNRSIFWFVPTHGPHQQLVFAPDPASGGKTKEDGYDQGNRSILFWSAPTHGPHQPYLAVKRCFICLDIDRRKCIKIEGILKDLQVANQMCSA